MMDWLKLKTKPFVDLREAEKFIRHFKFFNPKKEFRAGYADDDVVVFVGSIGAEIQHQEHK